MKPHEITTAVHKADATGNACELCGKLLPLHNGKPGQYIGVITSFSPPDSAYAIGQSNKHPLCDGTPATQFAQMT